MKKVILTIIACISASFILHAQELDNRAGTVLYNGNFDGLQAGDYIAQSHPVWWTTWNFKPGTSEDALITTEQASSALNSVKCVYGNDLVFKAGNKTTGVYGIDFDIYVPDGASGYFSLQHIFKDPESEWSIEVYFNHVFATLPQKNYILLNMDKIPFTFPLDTWVPISLFIDLDSDIANIKINNIQYYQWQFSIKQGFGVGAKQLAAVNFCPPDAGDNYYIDNFVYSCLSNTSVPALTVTPASIHETITEGTPATITKHISIANTGEAKGSYFAWLEGVSNNWISLTGATSGSVPIGGSAGFSAMIKSEGLANGTYTAKLKISSNDPNEPLFVIPCTLVFELPTPELSVSPTSIEETVSASTTITRPITITNSGTAVGNYEAKLEVASGNWISLSGATTGTVSIGSSKTFDAIINAEGLQNDTYTATIKITTNDPVHPLFEIPCTVIVTTEGITTVTLGERITVFPNPTNGMIYVETHSLASLQNVEIFDVMGRTAPLSPFGSPTGGKAPKGGKQFPSKLLEGWQAKPDGVVLNISHLPSGIYFVKIITDNGIVTRKIVKQ